jgi:hypothetical protein
MTERRAGTVQHMVAHRRVKAEARAKRAGEKGA